jgi:hypothetical protein
MTGISIEDAEAMFDEVQEYHRTRSGAAARQAHV